MTKVHTALPRVVVTDASDCCSIECDRQGRIAIRLLPADANGPLLREFGAAEVSSAVAAAFKVNWLEGFFHLATKQLGVRLPAALSYFREFIKSIYIHWILAHRATGAAPGDAPVGMLEAWASVAQDVPRLETLHVETLRGIWTALRQSTRASLAEHKMSIRELMEQHGEEWHDIGTPFLKLADGSGEAERPFSLFSGYASGISLSNTTIATPIAGVIFGECRVPGLGRHYYTLLRRAAELSGVVRRLLDSQEIFGVCPLIPRDAHELLRDAPGIREIGLKVYVPMWWRDIKPPPLAVRTHVGSAAPKRIGSQPLLDLRTSYVVGDHALSEAEWRQIVRNSVDGLVLVRGVWTLLDRARVEAAMKAGRRGEELRARGGATYGEALELMGADVVADAPSSAASAEEVRHGETIESFIPGPWLAEAQAAIARYDLRSEANPGVLLRGQLRGYQRQGVSWLSLMMDVGAGACLADDMGLGKSYQVIALIVALQSRGAPGPHLIVVPASLLANWREELTKWAPTLEVGVVHGPDDETSAGRPYVTLTSYGTLMRRPALQEPPWELIVLDEAQAIKNPDAKLTRTVKSLKSRRRICVTGTPIENHIGDLWSIMDFLNPGLLGDAGKFRAWARGLSPGAAGLAPLRKLVRPFILRRLKTDPDVAPHLPPKVEARVYCGLTALQSNLYGQAYYRVQTELAAAEGIARHGLAFTLLNHLKQICNHPAQYLKDNDYDPHSSGKFICLAQLARTIAERGEKVLVFTQYQTITAALAAHLEPVFGRPGLVLDGETPVKQRQKLVAQFQDDGGPPFVVLTYKVGGTGFNLTAACNVIHFDRWYNPAVENQATDRAYRLGQTKGVVVHKFICRGTLEERIEQLLYHKEGIAAGILAADDEEPISLGDLSPDELLSLAALDPDRARGVSEPSE